MVVLARSVSCAGVWVCVCVRWWEVQVRLVVQLFSDNEKTTSAAF